MPNSRSLRWNQRTTTQMMNRPRLTGNTMAIDLSIVELAPPRLQFGGASAHPDPKAGLLAAGPFDLRFGSARNVSGDDRSVLTELVDLAGTLYLGSLLNNCCATLITSSFL